MKDAVDKFIDEENESLEDYKYIDSFKLKLFNQVCNSTDYQNLEDIIQEEFEYMKPY